LLIADPAVLKSVSPSQAFVGQTVTFTLTVTNDGNTPVTSVVITDPISSFLDIVQLTSTKGTTAINGHSAVFNIGTVNPGEVITLTIVTRVNNTAVATTDIVNVATLTHNSNGTTTSETSNSVTFRILGQPSLPITGEESPASDANRPAQLAWIISWVFIFMGLILSAYGIYHLRGAGAHRQKARVYVEIGVALLLISFIWGVSGLRLLQGEATAVSVPSGQHLQLVSSSTAQPNPFLPAVVIVVPTSTPEPIETLPAYPTPTPPPAAVAPGPTTTALDSSSVTRILIPSQKVDAEVKYIPFDGLSWDMKGLRQEVAWLGNTSWPGLGSNTALAGHITLKGGILGPFHYLDKLEPSAEIIVYTEQNAYTYTVREQHTVEPTDLSVTEVTQTPQITLITCTDWDQQTKTFLRRRIVVADLVAVTSLPQP